GYSEDSDYTSDLNYPVGGQGANSSASQFRTAANQLATPQRSLETSRENSYERDDYQVPSTVGCRLTANSYSNYMSRGHTPRYDEPYPGNGPPQRYNSTMHQQYNTAETSEPLSYNSRPKGYKGYSQDGWYSEGYDYPNNKIDDTRICSDTEYYPSTTSSKIRGKELLLFDNILGRPSLERQTTLYDEQQMHYGNSDVYPNDTRIGKMSAIYPECQTDIIHDDYYNSIINYVYQDERYGQDDEDRQWDSGGKWYLDPNIHQENKRNRKSLPQRPASSIGINRSNHRPIVTRQRSYESEELDYSGSNLSQKRKTLQDHSMPRQDGRITGKKLPPTPMKPSNIIQNRKPISLPATPGRQLPRTRTPPSISTAVDKNYYKSNYNEDYNYAYQESQDNLQQSISQYSDNIYSTQVMSTTTTTNLFNTSNEPEIDDEVYSETQNIKNNTYHTNYITQSQQNYSTLKSAYDVNNQQSQQYIENSYSTSYEQASIQQDQNQQQEGQSIYHDQTSIYQNDTYPIVNEIENYENVPDELMIDDKNYKNTYEKDYQDSYSESLQQDQFPESYEDLYKNENYHDEQNGTVAFSDYNVTTTTANYDQKSIAISVYNQQQQLQQYDNNTYQTNEELSLNSQDDYQLQHRENDLNQQNIYTNYDDEYTDDYHDQYQDGDSYQEVPELSITTPKGQTKINGYQSSESEYFYLSQDELIDANSSKDRRKKLAKRDINPLLQQNTDSLESRDDELKDSFETAVSSGGSSQVRKGFSEYSTAGESSPIPATSIDSPMTVTVTSAQYYVNISDNVVSSVSSNITTTAMIHTAMMTNGKRQLARNESYVDDDDDVDIDSEHKMMIQDRNRVQQPQQQTEILNEKEHSAVDVSHNIIQRKDSQLSNRSQINLQSTPSLHQQQQQQAKLSRGDSYVDDNFEGLDGDSGSGGSRRESYQGSATTLGRTDSFQKRELTRGGSIYGHSYSTPQPISRAESYQRGYFKDQDSINDEEIVLSNTINGEYKMRDETLERYERGEEALARGSRENSLVEPYKSTPPMSLSASPRGSITKQTSLDESVQMDTPPRSPPEPLPDEDLLDIVGAPPIPTQLKERPEMTAKQRWHWAYNKIIMQLN
ncbi:hypothetical protein PV325_014024, partial [Microctonus aethiopoides]